MLLKKETQNTLERIIGKPICEVSQMDAQEEIRFVESKTKKPLVFSKVVDYRMRGRGSPYIIKLQEAEESAMFLKHRATRKDRLAVVSFIIGVVGAIAGIIGIAIALV